MCLVWQFVSRGRVVGGGLSGGAEAAGALAGLVSSNNCSRAQVPALTRGRRKDCGSSFVAVCPLAAAFITTARGEPPWHRRERRGRARDRRFLQAQAAASRLNRHHGSEAPMVLGLNAAHGPFGLARAAGTKGGGSGQQPKGKGKAATWKGGGMAGGGGGPGGGKGPLLFEMPWLAAQPRSRPPLEWLCQACGTSNRASRNACRACGFPKPWASAKGNGVGGKATTARGGPIGANGHGPLLGNRGTWGQSRLGYGGAAAAAAPSNQQEKGGGKAGKGGWMQQGPASGKGDAGFTVVNYALGNKPKVQAQAPQTAGGRAYPITKFHLLDEDDDAYAEQDLQMQMDHEEQQAAAGDEGDAGEEGEEQQEQVSEEEMLQAAKTRLWMRQNMLRQVKANFGKGHPQTRMAIADVEEALQRLREVRGPKSWHIRAREVERKAEAKERSIERRQAQIEQNKAWMEEVRQEFEMQQRSLEEANEIEAREARELWEQVESIKRESSGDDGRDQGNWGRRGGARKAVADLGQRLAAAQEEAAARGCEDLHQMLAEAGAAVAQLEADEDGAQAHGDAGVDDEWCDEGENEDDDNTPPWRRGDGGGKTGRWSPATRRRSEHGGGAVGAAAATATATGTDGAGAADGSAMEWAAQGTERTRAPKRGADGDNVETQGPSQQARDAQRRADDAVKLAAEARREARKQKALDKLRGQVQVEKNAEIARRQQAAGVNVVECAQEWTSEQLEQNTKLIEQINREFEARTEQKLAQMSEDEVLRLLDEPGW